MLHHSTYKAENNSKQWITFVHGAGGNSSIWFNQVRFFKAYFNILLIDLRGHGKSRLTGSQIPEKHSFTSCVQDVAMTTKSIPVTSIVGHSWGGRMALQYAAKMPSDTLERVWLLDTVPGKGM